MSDEFDAGAWIGRLAVALRRLCEAQGLFLEDYWRHNPRQYVEFDGRDETPFPLDDLTAVYFLAKHGGMYGAHAPYAPLRAAMDPVRSVLRFHPVLWRALGVLLDNDDFWVQIRGHGSRTSLTGLIGGLMARADELPGDGFEGAAGELHAFLDSSAGGDAGAVPGGLDIGYWKDVWIQLGGGNAEAHKGEYVCAACFSDKGLRAFVEGGACENVCSFCGAESTERTAALLVPVVLYINECLSGEYDAAENRLSYDRELGGYGLKKCRRLASLRAFRTLFTAKFPRFHSNLSHEPVPAADPRSRASRGDDRWTRLANQSARSSGAAGNSAHSRRTGWQTSWGADKTVGKWERDEVEPSPSSLLALQNLGLIDRWPAPNGEGENRCDLRG